jgi:ribosomal protein S18 acetylase RimI-like enzyme
VRIREFNPDDYDAVDTLWKRAGILLGVSDTKKEVLRMYDAHPELFLLGELDDRVIAVVMGGFDGRRGIVHHLAVDPDYRNQGYGRRIMKELEQRFNNLNVVKINFWLRKENSQAIGFYQNLDYHVRDDLLTISKVLRRK